MRIRLKDIPSTTLVWIIAIIIWILQAHTAYSQSGLSLKQVKALNKAIEKGAYCDSFTVPSKDTLIENYQVAVAQCKSASSTLEMAYRAIQESNKVKEQRIETHIKIEKEKDKKIRRLKFSRIVLVGFGLGLGYVIK